MTDLSALIESTHRPVDGLMESARVHHQIQIEPESMLGLTPPAWSRFFPTSSPMPCRYGSGKPGGNSPAQTKRLRLHQRERSRNLIRVEDQERIFEHFETRNDSQ